MNDDISTETGSGAPLTRLDGREPDGRFAPGNNLGTPFGPDNPPPRSPGRPKKGAWLRELEERIKDPRIRQGLADKLLKIALKGRDGDAIRALQEIQNRTGEPVALRVDGMTRQELVQQLGELMVALTNSLPPEFRPVLVEAARRHFVEQERRWLLDEHRDG